MNLGALRVYAVLCCFNGKHSVCLISYFSNDLKVYFVPLQQQNENGMTTEATMTTRRTKTQRFVPATGVAVSGKRLVFGLL